VIRSRALLAVCLAAVLPLAATSARAGTTGGGDAERRDGRAWRVCEEGELIEDLAIDRIPVFDPAEPESDFWAWRLANLLHSPMQTRERTIRSLLTLLPGDRCSIDRLEEAERILRDYGFIRDAWIEPLLDADDRLVLGVRVQDAWSTSVGVSFSTEGGKSRSKVKLEEENLFGTGTHLEWERKEDQDRTEKVFVYENPALFGSRWRLRAEHSDNSDGLERQLFVRRPFIALSDRWSFSAFIDELDRDEKVYETGLEVDRWRIDGLKAAVESGFSPRGLVDDRLFRWHAGLQVDRQTWSRSPVQQHAIARPDLRPYDRDLLLATFRASWRRVAYRREQHLDTAERIQDLDVGREFWMSLAHSLPGVSDDSGARLAAGVRKGWVLGGDTFFLVDASHRIERLRGGWVNGVTSLGSRWFYRRAPRHTLYASLQLDYGSNLEGPLRFRMGGDTGLRGYRSRAFTGERQVLLTIEDRFFPDWTLWSLFRVGLVGFFELGGAWSAEDSFGLDTLHPDVGLGLRALILPSANGTTAHLNVAVPLDNDPTGRRQVVRFSFTTLTRF
jgi:hypothetical protein